MKRQEAVGRVLAQALTEIANKLDAIGLPSDGPGQWRTTIVLRNVAHDDLTVLCGEDDEAALIIALNRLGASRGRSETRISASGPVPDSNR